MQENSSDQASENNINLPPQSDSNKSASVISNTVISTDSLQNKNTIGPPVVSKDAKIEINIFRNSDHPGYGYNIIVDGIPRIHQPNVPAKPGNDGFETEEQARKVAELVKQKVRNNIMPPTIEVRELDSLGIK